MLVHFRVCSDFRRIIKAIGRNNFACEETSVDMCLFMLTEPCGCRQHEETQQRHKAVNYQPSMKVFVRIGHDQFRNSQIDDEREQSR